MTKRFQHFINIKVILKIKWLSQFNFVWLPCAPAIPTVWCSFSCFIYIVSFSLTKQFAIISIDILKNISINFTTVSVIFLYWIRGPYFSSWNYYLLVVKHKSKQNYTVMTDIYTSILSRLMSVCIQSKYPFVLKTYWKK